MKSAVLVIQWAARITGLLLFLAIGFLAIGEGVPNWFEQPRTVQGEFLALALMLLGWPIGWKWSVAGGAISLIGFGGFCVIEFSANGKPPGGFIQLLAIPGVLFLAGAALARRG